LTRRGRKESSADDHINSSIFYRGIDTQGQRQLALRASEPAGTLAGLLAAAGASAVGYALAARVFELPYHFNPWV
jgi:putative ABC transport system permease protein